MVPTNIIIIIFLIIEFGKDVLKLFKIFWNYVCIIYLCEDSLWGSFNRVAPLKYKCRHECSQREISYSCRSVSFINTICPLKVGNCFNLGRAGSRFITWKVCALHHPSRLREQFNKARFLKFYIFSFLRKIRLPVSKFLSYRLVLYVDFSISLINSQ